MKTSLKIFALALVLAGFGMNVNAQTNSANGTATAVVKKALTITKDVDLSFGTFAGKSTATSDVTISSAGVRGGSADLIGTDGAAAQFTVAGQASTEVAITLPATNTTLTHTTVPANTMTIDKTTYVCDKTIGGVSLDESGTLVLKIGATLSVGIDQAVGTYNGTFAVSVNYN